MHDHPTHEDIPVEKGSIGSIVGTVIIIALIILGGLYFWGKRIEEAKTAQVMTAGNDSLYPNQNEAAAITSMNKSDDLDSINADLKNTKLDNLDAEMQTQTAK